MTTEQKTEATQQAAPPSTEGTQESTEKAVDWAERVKVLETERDAKDEALRRAEKIAGDLRSQQIQLLKQAQRDDILRAIPEYLHALSDQFSAGGTAEEFRKKAKEIDDKYTVAAQTETFRQAQAEQYTKLKAIGDELKTNIDTDPAFENAGLLWSQGVRTGNPIYLYQAVSEAYEAQARIYRDKAKNNDGETAKKMREAAEKAKREALEESGAFDTSSGRSAGSGIKRQYTRQDLANMTPEEYAAARPHILKIG